MRDNLIVVRVDGGICSQINFVAFGLALQERLGASFEVKFDLGWFAECGKDKDGKFARNWDFPKAFPDVELKVATPDETARLAKRHCLKANRLSFRDIPAAPAYICGYPSASAALEKLRPFLQERFSPAIDGATRGIIERMGAVASCAVHVRRGDLKTFNRAYGYPTSLDYFSRATAIVRGLCGSVHFWLFSDEPDYVRSQVVPALPKGAPFTVLSDNGSDRGFVDLFLMAQCQYVVSSIGSLGVFAAYLSRQSDAVLICSRCRREVFAALPNVVYLNDDRRYLAEQSGAARQSRPGERKGWEKVKYKVARHFEKRARKMEKLGAQTPLQYEFFRLRRVFRQFLCAIGPQAVRARLHRRKYAHIVFMGINCDLAFRFYCRWGFVDSSLFAWANTVNLATLTAALGRLDDLADGPFQFSGSSRMWCQSDAGIWFHGRLRTDAPTPGELDGDLDDLRARIRHLGEKLRRCLADDAETLVVHRLADEDAAASDLAARLDAFEEAIRRLGARDWKLLVVCRAVDLPRMPPAGNRIYRAVKSFNPMEKVTHKELGDPVGWHALFTEFAPAKVLPKAHAFKFE